MKKELLVCYFMILSMPLALAQYGPAGVGGEEGNEEGKAINTLWLRATDIDQESGSEVTEWPDFSDFGNDAALPLGRDDLGKPTFTADTLNGFAWVNFNGDAFLEIADDESLDSGDGLAVFIVINRNQHVVSGNDLGEQSMITKRKHWNAWSHIPPISLDAEGLQHAYEIRFEDKEDKGDGKPYGSTITAFINGNLPDGNGQDVFANYQYGSLDTTYLVNYVYNSTWGGTIRVNGEATTRSDRQEGNPNPIYVGPIINSTEPVYIGAAELDPPGNFGDNPDKDEPDPAATEDDFLHASIAEIIMFKGELDSTQTILVENYLAAKYLLHLKPEIRYYSDSVFTYDLIGIGTETGGDVLDIAQGDALGLEMLNNTLDEPQEYLIAAHNGLEHGYTTENIGVENMERWTRTWKIEKTGTMDAAMSFNFSEAGLNAADASEYVLLYAEDDTSAFMPLDLSGTIRFRVLKFELTDDLLKTGYYAVGHKTPAEEPNSISQYNLNDALGVFPNPVKNQLNLTIKTPIRGEVTIRIKDYTGREVSAFKDIKSDYEYKSQVNTRQLKSGVYFIEYTLLNRKGIKPFIKE